MKSLPYWLLGCLTYVVITPVYAGPAISQFEIKGLEVALGQWDFQSQNALSFAQPRREFAELVPGEFAYDDNEVVRQRHALELEVSTFSWMRNRVGIEFEKARIEEPTAFADRQKNAALKLEEIAFEAVAVLVPQRERRFGLGMLVEYQYAPDADDPDSVVFGPIVTTAWRRWNVTFNPGLIQFFGGDEADNKVDFIYACQILFSASEQLDLGIEGYGTLDRLGSSGRASNEARLFGDHDLHRLGPVAYVTQSMGADDDQQVLSVGVGLFFGITAATPDYTFKWSVEFEF